MKKCLFFFFTGLISFAAGQQNVGIGTATPDSSAALDVSGTNKGMLIPRLSTEQRKSIVAPAFGLLVFDTDKGVVMFYDGDSWKALSFSDENKTAPQTRASSDPALNAYFGARVAISGDYAIIGAMRYKVPGLSDMGSAYIFNKTAGGWKQVTRLAAPDSAQFDNFGGAVAISGDYAIVGSCSKQIGEKIAQGKAYIYHRNGADWLLDTALINPGGKEYDQFGWSVGICSFNSGGPGVAIGIPNLDATAGNDDKGGVYFYRKAGNTWQFVQSMVPGDLGTSDNYGRTIAMDTDYVVIGATSQDNFLAVDAGAVYIYAFGGGVWNFQQRLGGFTARSQFGSGLSISSNMLAIGAPFAVAYSNTSSAVYVYKRTGSTWSIFNSIYLFENEAISFDNITFGSSVSLSGTTLLIGASSGTIFPTGSPSGRGATNGAVYIYKILPGSTIFTRTNRIESEYPLAGDFFGVSVNISGTKYVIGNPHAISSGVIGAGDVYFGNLSE